LTTWNTSTTNEILTLPFSESPQLKLTVNWGDGQTDVVTRTTSLPISHSYRRPGLHNVSILGPLHGFSFAKYARNAAKLVDIASWGDAFFIDGKSAGAFAGCVNLYVSALPSSQPVFFGECHAGGDVSKFQFQLSIDLELA